jgi:hypothetical protein
VIQISSFKRTQQSRCFLPVTWIQKQIQFPKRCVFQLLQFWTMAKVHKPSGSGSYTPSSEPFRIYLTTILFTWFVCIICKQLCASSYVYISNFNCYQGKFFFENRRAKSLFPVICTCFQSDIRYLIQRPTSLCFRSDNLGAVLHKFNL